jgi:hypothetical protein
LLFGVAWPALLSSLAPAGGGPGAPGGRVWVGPGPSGQPVPPPPPPLDEGMRMKSGLRPGTSTTPAGEGPPKNRRTPPVHLQNPRPTHPPFL